MRARFVVGLITGLVAGVLVSMPMWASSAPRGEGPLFAVLLGENEIGPDGKRGAGDPDGVGSATVLIHEDTQVCFGLTASGISTPTAAHIHEGKARVNGPIVVHLTPPSGGDPGSSSGCVAADPELLEDIRKHPRQFYVNIHTGDFPGGAIRGQLFHRPGG
jgi:CHRD domain